MRQADSRDLRQALYRAWVTRGSDEGQDPKWDNTGNIAHILALRHEAANLVGFDVTGLPDTVGLSRDLGLWEAGKQGTGVPPGDHKGDIIQQAKDDIAFFRDLVVSYAD